MGITSRRTQHLRGQTPPALPVPPRSALAASAKAPPEPFSVRKRYPVSPEEFKRIVACSAATHEHWAKFIRALWNCDLSACELAALTWDTFDPAAYTPAFIEVVEPMTEHRSGYVIEVPNADGKQTTGDNAFKAVGRYCRAAGVPATARDIRNGSSAPVFT